MTTKITIYELFPLSHEFAEDARYTWPERFKWIVSLCRRTLAEYKNSN